MGKLKFSMNSKLHVLFTFCPFSYFNFIVVVLLQYLMAGPTKKIR